MSQRDWAVLINIFPIFVFIVVTTSAAVLAFTRRRVAGAVPFFILMILDLVWILGYVCEIGMSTLEGKMFWNHFATIGLFLSPVLILVFVLAYCGIDIRRFRLLIILVFVFPAVMIFLTFTNPASLAYSNPRLAAGGPFDFYHYDASLLTGGQFVYNFILMALALFFLCRRAVRQTGKVRLQTLIMVAGLLLPIVWAGMRLVEGAVWQQFDLTLYFLSLGNLVLAFNLFWLGALDLPPIVRDLIFDQMQGGALVFDAADRLVDANRVSYHELGILEKRLLGRTLKEMPPDWQKFINLKDNSSDSYRDVCIDWVSPRQFFDQRITTIHDRRHRFVGHLVMFHNVTRQKETELALQQAFDQMESQVAERTAQLSATIEHLKNEIDSRQKTEEALRNSEDKFRTIIEQSAEGFMLLDENGQVIEANPALERITGVSAESILGKYAWDFQFAFVAPEKNTPDMVEKYRTILLDAIQNEKSYIFTRPAEIEITKPDQTRCTIQQVTFLIHTEKGTRVGAIIRDITEQKRVEEALKNINIELERRVAERTVQLESINKELEAFSYSVSHDLRSPLRSMSGFSQALQEDFGALLPPEAHVYLNRIEKGVQRMNQLINGLLQLSRLGSKPLEFEIINMEALVFSVWEELSPEIDGRTVRLKVDSMPPCQADALLMKQVYYNLLSNAIKYTRPRPAAEIEVGWEQQGQERVYWVKDNGVGFDMQYTSKLFSVFQRLHSDEQFEGTGVGLTTVQRIILRHGGRIWANAAIDQGATFYFTLGTPPEL